VNVKILDRIAKYDILNNLYSFIFTMSGHSKWSTIKRQKGALDVKRGKTFTKIANSITIAVKQGGGTSDPTQNPKLRLAVDMAKNANMPKANIQRAIERANTKGDGSLSEVLYEGFGPGGVSIIVEAATDNSNRTTAEVKSIFNKNNARFSQPGSSVHLFDQTGEIIINKNGKSIDDIFLIAADFGAEDVKEEGSLAFIYTNLNELEKIKANLEKSGFRVESADIIRIPKLKVEVSSDVREKLTNFIEDLEELDDVQKVFINAN